MPEKLPAALFDPRRLVIDRLFFAIFPDAPTAERIIKLSQQLRSQYGFEGRTLAKDRLHVSLYHVGDFVGVPADIVARANEAASRVKTPAFRMVFDRAMSFSGNPRNRPLVLRSADNTVEVMEFQRALVTAMKEGGLGQPRRGRFAPHLTLLYGDHHIAQAIESVAWTVREFVLVHSLVGRTRYAMLSRRPLAAS